VQQPEQQKSQLHFYKHDQSYDYLVITLSHYCGRIKIEFKIRNEVSYEKYN